MSMDILYIIFSCSACFLMGNYSIKWKAVFLSAAACKFDDV